MPGRLAVTRKASGIAKDDQDAMALAASLLSFIPIAGTLISAVSMYGASRGASDETAYDTGLATAGSEFYNSFSKQYQVPIDEVYAIRKDLLAINNLIKNKQLDADQLRDRLNNLELHADDYIQGTQRSIMHEARDKAKQDYANVTSEIVDLQKDADQKQMKLDVISDISLQPQNDTNDVRVKNVSSDIGLQTSKTSPKIYMEKTE